MLRKKGNEAEKNTPDEDVGTRISSNMDEKPRSRATCASEFQGDQNNHQKLVMLIFLLLRWTVWDPLATS